MRHLIMLGLILVSSFLPCAINSLFAADTDDDVPLGGVSSSLQPDLFTGALTGSIPFDVPLGRNGMQPNLRLVYESTGGNGWVGMGWKLEQQGIFRQTKWGVDFANNTGEKAFVARIDGIAGDLMQAPPPAPSDEWSAKIQGNITRVKMVGSGANMSWVVTTPQGRKMFFGTADASRVRDSADLSRILAWSLDRVEDPDGNYMALYYVRDQEQLYLDRIEYAGNGSLAPTNIVTFYRENGRPDVTTLYTGGIGITTAKRLRSVQVKGNGNVMRTYQLKYGSSATTRSLLTSIQQFGKDATVSTSTGAITNEATATKLPAVSLSYTAEFNGSMTWNYDFSGSNEVLGGTNWARSEGDFNGANGSDLLFHYADTTNGGVRAVMCFGGYSNNFSCQSLLQPVLTGSYGSTGWVRDVADINGDGTTDLLLHYADTANGGIRVRSLLSQNYSLTDMSETQPVPSGVSYGATNWTRTLADIDGDGKADLLLHYADSVNGGVRIRVIRSNGDGTFTALPDQQPVTTGSYGTSEWTRSIADVNGDSKADVVVHRASSGLIQALILLSDGDGSFTAMPMAQFTVSGNYAGTGWARSVADVNGDGNADLVFHYANTNNTGIRLRVALSKGDGTLNLLPENVPVATGNYLTTGWVRSFGDANGDGKTDLLFHYANASSVVIRIMFSKGDGTFTAGPHTTPLTGHNYTGAGWMRSTMDVGGDGQTEVVFHYASASTPGMTGLAFSSVRGGSGPPPMLLSRLANGIGGASTITYYNPTGFKNTARMFVAGRITICDNYAIATSICTGTSQANSYGYSGGYYHMSDREFRGFNVVGHSMSISDPANLDLLPGNPLYANSCYEGCATSTMHYFHQGNDLLPDLNTPGVAVGYMKGKIYKQVTRIHFDEDTSHDHTLPRMFETNTMTFTYEADADGVAPYFTPLKQADASICDLDAVCGKQTRVVYTTDSYGNVIREDQYGDLSTTSDDKTTVRTFSPNTNLWLLAFPTSETVYEGIGTSVQRARTEILYDGAGTNCAAVGDGMPTPTKGHPTRVLNWLSVNPGASPVSRMAYDSYGNQLCTRDPRGFTTSIAYDVTQTYPSGTTNALGHSVSSAYFSGIAADLGLYGQVRSVTDANGKVTLYEYDKLGRRTKLTSPDTQVTTIVYNSMGGGINVQNNQTTLAGLTKKVFYDGLGRTIKTEQTGPDAKTIVEQTEYIPEGLVKRISIPRFTTNPAAIWTNYKYDMAGRLAEIVFADGTKVHGCFDEFVSVVIDADDHRKRETRDANGRLVKVEEYSGVYTSCGTGVDSPYSTTTYQYDVLGNLRYLTDTKGNVSEMQHDSLSRKVFMHDPDMGNWTYEYDQAGNLTKQTDAKGQILWFQYDELNRKKQKDYAVQKTYPSGDVVYLYDGSNTLNQIGRFRKQQDASGSSEVQYDSMGRTVRTDRILDAATYVTQVTYDGLGRESTITYPSGQTITYTYTGPWLEKVSEGSNIYVQYDKTLYNATGQIGKATFGNGVVTTFAYTSPMNRLYTLKTQKGTTPAYQDLQYVYSNIGNVKDIYDATVAAGAADQHFAYDNLDRLTIANGPYGTSGANLSLIYNYDEIGNMLSNTQVGTYVYPASGAVSVRPHAVSTAGGNSYAYDLNGNLQSATGPGLNRSLTYNADNVPTTITNGGQTTVLVYDGDGSRVKKTVGSTVVRYINKLYECDNTICTRFIFAGPERIASVATNGTIHYWHADHLGSSSVITDNTGTKVEAISYYPYGGTRTDLPGTPVNVPYKYTGQELDASTGLYDYGARHYDPVLGRFISADTIVPDPSNPQDFNRYSYVQNNPLNATDPSGHHTVNEVKNMPNIRLLLTDWSADGCLCLTDAQILVNSGRITFTQYTNFLPLYHVCTPFGCGIGPVYNGLHIEGINIFVSPGGNRLADFEKLVNPPNPTPTPTPPPPPPPAVTPPSVSSTFFNFDHHMQVAQFFLPGGGIKSVIGKAITTVIGRGSALKNLPPGMKSLGDRLPDLGNPKANWKQNAGVLREEMRRGSPILDVSPGNTKGEFLNAERNLLRDRGWTFDSKTNYWMPPNP